MIVCFFCLSIFGCWTVGGTNKTFEDVTLGSGKWWWAFFSLYIHFIDQNLWVGGVIWAVWIYPTLCDPQKQRFEANLSSGQTIELQLPRLSRDAIEPNKTFPETYMAKETFFERYNPFWKKDSGFDPFDKILCRRNAQLNTFYPHSSKQRAKP